MRRLLCLQLLVPLLLNTIVSQGDLLAAEVQAVAGADGSSHVQLGDGVMQRGAGLGVWDGLSDGVGVELRDLQIVLDSSVYILGFVCIPSQTGNTFKRLLGIFSASAIH